jgi:hypothetical protein
MELAAPQTGARVLERLSLVLLSIAVVASMVLGSGASVGVRIAVQSTAGLAVLATIASMVAAGSFRIVRSPLWLAPAGLILLGAAQMLPLPSLLGGAGSLESLPRPAPLTATANRHATQEGILLWCSALFVSAVASCQIRTQRQASNVSLTLGVVLLVSGLAGCLGLWSSGNGGWFDSQSVIGPLAYQASVDFDATGVWLTPAAPRSETFGGFWDRSHWTACVLGFVPWMAILGAFNAKATSTKKTPRAVSIASTSLAACLWALAVAMGDPLTLCLAGFLAVAALVVLAPSNHRALPIWTGAAGIALTVCGIALRFVLGGASSDFGFAQWAAGSDNRSLAAAAWDLGWLGGGIGALPDVWPMYRNAPAETAPQASSLLMLLVETGWLGVVVFGATAAIAVAQWKRMLPKWDPSTQLMVSALAAGLIGMLGIGLLGSGLEAPGIAIVGALLLGCLARGFSGTNAWSVEGVAA